MSPKNEGRIAIWARGNASICLDNFGDCRLQNGRQIAFELAKMSSTNGIGKISHEKWLQMASSANLGIRRPIAQALFQGAFAATKSISSPSNGPSPFVPIPFICAAIALMEREKDENAGEFIGKNSGLFCLFFVWPEMPAAFLPQNRHQNWVEFLQGNGRVVLHKNALAQLDSLFEGAALDGMENEESPQIPMPPPYIHAKPLSILLKEMPDGNFSLSELASLLHQCLQPDLFQLDRIGDNENCPQGTLAMSRPRSLTAAASARRRRLQFRNWQRMELLSAPGLRGGNLRLLDAGPGAGPIFHPLALESAVISNCESAGPIVLGPVRCFLLLKNVRNMVISAISSQIRLHNCEHLTLFCQNESPILLAGKCAKIRLAPYNVFYNGLAIELAYAGMKLSSTVRLAARAINLNSTDNSADFPLDICALLEPEQFYLQPTPFPTNPDSNFHNSFLNSIPANYLNCWLRVKENARKRADKMNEAQLAELCPLKRCDLTYLLRKIKRD